MTLPWFLPGVRRNRSASVQRGCAHRRGELCSTGGVFGSEAFMLVVLLVKRWFLRTVGASLRPIGCGIRARDGVGGSDRVDFVYWW